MKSLSVACATYSLPTVFVLGDSITVIIVLSTGAASLRATSIPDVDRCSTMARRITNNRLPLAVRLVVWGTLEDTASGDDPPGHRIAVGDVQVQRHRVTPTVIGARRPSSGYSSASLRGGATDLHFRVGDAAGCRVVESKSLDRPEHPCVEVDSRTGVLDAEVLLLRGSRSVFRVRRPQ
jgi:hypothetical protein